VTAGSHAVEARIDWARSRPLTIRIDEGETVEIEVSLGWRGLRAFWHPQDAVTLRPVSPDRFVAE
jgi:hypothetical protein